MSVAASTSRYRGRQRAVTLTFAALMLWACRGPEQPTVEPDVWRRYAAVRLDTITLPLVWAIADLDTTYLVSGAIELRVDGTTAWRSGYRLSGRADTVHSAWFSTYSVANDSIEFGSLRIALSDTTLVIPTRFGPGQAWYYRLTPPTDMAP